MMFTLNHKANTNGSSLQMRIDYIDTRLAETLFGEPDLSWYDYEKGYENRYAFVGENGRTATLYDRFGQWRIGAHDYETAVEFDAWLKGKTCQK